MVVQTSVLSWLKPASATPIQQVDVSGGGDIPRQTSNGTAGDVSNEFMKRQSLSGRADEISPMTDVSIHDCRPATHGQSPLPAEAVIRRCSAAHLKALRRLNSVLLPIAYPDKFYRETLDDPVVASLTRLAFWRSSGPQQPALTSGPSQAVDESQKGQLVAAIRCRLGVQAPDDTASTAANVELYIATLATLSPFRSYGIAKHLLEEVTDFAIKRYHIVAVTAHVWEANEEALAWYKNRGFKVVGREDGYYLRLKPQTAAWVVRRDVGPKDSQGFDSA